MSSPSTSKETTLSEVDFTKTKSFLHGELSSLGFSNVDLPVITSEKKDLKIEFTVTSISKAALLDCFQILKNHIENLRIHTFEPGYYCIQALNENLFETKNLLDTIRFRFYSGRTKNRVEITKKGDFTREELFAILGLFQFLKSEKNIETAKPEELLASLGVEVFHPANAEKNGKSISFDQIAGYEGVKQQILESIILPLKNPEILTELSKLTRKFPSDTRPRAVLFEGDPGVGKTTMARVVSYMTGLPLIYVPVESIMSKYYGESAQNMAYVFDAAALFPGCLIFLDEIDSLAGNREEGMFEATRKILSVLLRKIDGFTSQRNSVTIGATNRKQDLDHALLSRFDRTIYFPLPDLEERSKILETYAIHLSKTERMRISEGLIGHSGRTIRDFCDLIERKWASYLIEKGLKPVPPPYELYLENTSKSEK
ncbi:Holliday junction DNA helicase RuvB, N-terminal domain protein [Leptospira kirschneri str. 200803703]|uniref:Holliday junction DNA helicase RuvB, N-terminal domain protein n=1 Tax=Leptospira kirschneri str. 200802841 TaxID=1193047 RepID=A0A828XUV7_9LEPT|nr:AAA family ATPase [Leptospira kirschneri]EMO78386.1 Holliday junction DNA helicase RuvB, N-terminal domain protein [Leptospira kirschneri str. 200801925]EKO50936.1 Holliday junction DNA helicase RuvB, N-terminal domain protein [Leptospira kirschneri str. 200802841]EKP07268.1 Holliday junction DNA helicase RuvB, N-terminal domain protein [Leptospira kirschneri str. 2008720114]EMK17182.1 Holliday junction DNA helicase RuvB, N-terminal domain protein [Leptospira kirschneri serovar Bim str. PUO 